MNVALDTKIRAGGGALALTLLLAGCATGPAYVRPSVDAPGAFKERPTGAAAAAPQPGWKSAAPQDAQNRGAWWEIFQDASLNQLEARVSVSNQTIVKAVATLQQARAVVGQARSAYYPTIQAGIAPGGTHANLRFLGDWVTFGPELSKEDQLLLCDAQTSGGLLIACQSERAKAIEQEIVAAGYPLTRIIGRAVEGPATVRIEP